MKSNVQKMREVLEAWLKAYDDFVAKPRNGKWPQSPCGTVVIPPIDAARLVEMTKSAISLPLCNCDVGTPDEQSKRYYKFCAIHNCKDCPLSTADSCELSWAQLPYKAESSLTKTGENVNSGGAIDIEVNKADEGGAE